MFNRIVSADAKIVLFGSRVRGEARQDSDWNVLVSFGKGFLLSAIATWLSVMPLQSCLGDVRDAKPPVATPTQIQSAQRWTRLDLSRITFNDDISYLSPAEQTLYRNCQSEFFQSLKRLSPKKQREMKAVYKWVPDVVKIIASRDYQERKKYIQHFKPGADLYFNITRDLYHDRKKLPECIEIFHVVQACEDMIHFRYPLQMIDTKNQSIEDTAKKCGFGYLSKMVDFCNDPQNQGKFYKKSVDNLTYKHTIDEVSAFQKVGSMYETEIWLDFKRYPFYYIYKFWKFDLKKVDTSNLTPKEYAKMERQLKCVPPEILVACRYKTYDSRISSRVCNKMIQDTAYIKKYAQNKGIYLSEEDAREVQILASEILKYATPLKLVKRDDQADLDTVARNFGFYGISGFDFYYKRKKKTNKKIQFCQSAPEQIPNFIAEAKDFYNLGMTVNPEETKKLYQNIENDTGIIIRHSGTQSGQMGADSRQQP